MMNVGRMMQSGFARGQPSFSDNACIAAIDRF